MDARSSENDSFSRHFNSIWNKAQPYAVQGGLLIIFVTYVLAGLPWFGGLSWVKAATTPPVSNLITAATFGLVFIAFTNLISIERNFVKSKDARVLTPGHLGDELVGFLNKPSLDIDLFAYTAETFLEPLSIFFRSLENTRNPPDSIRLRILVKEWKDSTSFLPGCARDAAEDLQGRRMDYRTLQAHHHNKMHYDLKGLLASVKPRVRVTAEIRLYHIDPFQKGMLINQDIGFWNLYPIESAAGDHSGVLDYMGHGLELAEFRRNGSPAESLAVQSMARWFDAVWTNCCSTKA